MIYSFNRVLYNLLFLAFMVYKILRAMRTRIAYVQTISMGETPNRTAALPCPSYLMSLPTTVMCVAVEENAFALS